MKVPHPGKVNHQDWARELLDTEPLLLDKIQASVQMPAEKAKALLVEALRFLHLVAFFNRRLTPAQPVDLAWHEFILFTRLYATFCSHKFGRFIHHHPGGKDAENRKNFTKTLQHYILTIGPPPPVFWGPQAAEMYQDAQCGNCAGNL